MTKSICEPSVQVLWRYSGPVPDHMPENVKVMKWLPQNDLLGKLPPVTLSIESQASLKQLKTFSIFLS